MKGAVLLATDEDVVNDLIGYLVLLKISMDSDKKNDILDISKIEAGKLEVRPPASIPRPLGFASRPPCRSPLACTDPELAQSTRASAGSACGSDTWVACCVGSRLILQARRRDAPPRPSHRPMLTWHACRRRHSLYACADVACM